MKKVNFLNLEKGINYYFGNELNDYGTFLGFDEEFAMFKPIKNLIGFMVWRGNVEFSDIDLMFIECETEKQPTND